MKFVINLTKKTVEILRFYIDQLQDFPAFSNVRTIKIFINQLLSYQSIRLEQELINNGSLTYQYLTYIKPEDFQYFTEGDFINIIGSENIKLYN